MAKKKTTKKAPAQKDETGLGLSDQELVWLYNSTFRVQLAGEEAYVRAEMSLLDSLRAKLRPAAEKAAERLGAEPDASE